MIEPGTSPEQVLAKLGISEPGDLDIEAIAYYCGATILYESLTGCEATIFGNGKKAIITVNQDGHPGRRRFSAGHELGHWMIDRDRSAFSCSKSEIESSWSAFNPETRANRYAGDLLLPLSMFVPLARGRPIELETLNDLAKTFKMSRTATAIKLIQHGSFPAVLAYYEAGWRKWFVRGDSVSAIFTPFVQAEKSTLTARLADYTDQEADDTRADHWFNHTRADQYYIHESCFRTGPESIITILWWQDEEQLIHFEKEDEERGSRRSYFRSE